MAAHHILWPFVSIRLSVTSHCSIKTAKQRITQTMRTPVF